MAKGKSCFGRLLLLIVILGVIAAAVLIYIGYSDYQAAITETPLSEKVAEVQAKPTYLPLSEMSETFTTAIVIVEDKRFYEHGALDVISIGRAIGANIKAMAFVEGGSTITQQVAKNLYFTQEKRVTRKIAEYFVARDLEDAYTKNEILELYCNIIFYGQNYYDVQSAAEGYFHKQPRELNFEEAAMLAGIPNAPSIYNPIDNAAMAAERQRVVIEILAENGFTE